MTQNCEQLNDIIIIFFNKLYVNVNQKETDGYSLSIVLQSLLKHFKQ